MLFIVCKIRNPVSFYLCSVHNNYGCDSLPTLRILNYNMIICVSEMSRHLSPFPFFRKTWGNFQPVISAFYPHNAFIQSLHAPCRGSGCPGPVRFAVIFRMCGIAVCKYIWLGAGLRGRILFTVRHDFFQSTKCLFSSAEFAVHKDLKSRCMAIYSAVFKQPRQHSRHPPNVWRIFLIRRHIQRETEIMFHTVNRSQKLRELLFICHVSQNCPGLGVQIDFTAFTCSGTNVFLLTESRIYHSPSQAFSLIVFLMVSYSFFRNSA